MGQEGLIEMALRECSTGLWKKEQNVKAFLENKSTLTGKTDHLAMNDAWKNGTDLERMNFLNSKTEGQESLLMRVLTRGNIVENLKKLVGNVEDYDESVNVSTNEESNGPVPEAHLIMEDDEDDGDRKMPAKRSADENQGSSSPKRVKQENGGQEDQLEEDLEGEAKGYADASSGGESSA